MPQQHPLTINVNDQLTIDAGSWQECVEEDQTPYRLTSPPQTTMYLFVPTMRALYHVVSKPSEESWPEQALPYAIAFKPPADWSLDEQTREIALPDAEPE